MVNIIEEWVNTPSKEHTHFFGEMDLNLNKSKEIICKIASHIAEECGYSAFIRKNNLYLSGIDSEFFKIIFDDNKVKYIELAKGEIIVKDKIPSYHGYKNGFEFGVSVRL